MDTFWTGHFVLCRDYNTSIIEKGSQSISVYFIERFFFYCVHYQKFYNIMLL